MQDDIPFDHIAELVRKISPEAWIKSYGSIALFRGGSKRQLHEKGRIID